MKLKNEFDSIREWAGKRGIYEKGDIKTQTLKLMEEVGELSRAILKEKPDEIIDSIGDIVIVLVSIAKFKNIKIEDCINSAYDIIAERKGEMKNGTFAKVE